jgi:hypothetical protein
MSGVRPIIHPPVGKIFQSRDDRGASVFLIVPPTILCKHNGAMLSVPSVAGRHERAVKEVAYSPCISTHKFNHCIKSMT